MELEHTQPHTTTTARGINRRTVLTAAAWSAPIIATAVATPLAAASGAPQFDLFMSGLQQGSSVDLFTADLTMKYTDGFTGGFTLMNRGPEPAPAGTIVQMRYDNRIVTPTDFEYRIGSADTQQPLSYTTPVSNGNESTVTFVLPVEVPVGEDVFGAGTIWVYTDYTLDLAYPNDALDDYKVMNWRILTSDSDTSDNLFGALTPTTVPANSPWGLELTATHTAHTTDRCAYNLPTAVTVTSVGPGTTPGDVTINLAVEAVPVMDATLTSLTIDGVATSGTLTSSQRGAYTLALARPLAAGQVVQAEFAYDVDPAGEFTNNGWAQVNAHVPSDPGIQDHRLTASSSDADNSACAL